MLKKTVVLVILLFVLFASFVGATRFYISRSMGLVSVVTTDECIPPRTQITPDILSIKDVPYIAVPSGASRSKQDFIDQVFFTGNIGLPYGTIITRDQVFFEGEIEIAPLLEKGKTILGIETDLVRTAGAMVRSGNRVRILAFRPGGEGLGWGNGETPSEAFVLFDNILVKGVINADTIETAKVEEGRGRVPAVVQVVVTPEQETVLIRHQEEYSIWFTILPEGYEPDDTILDYFDRQELIELIEEPIIEEEWVEPE